MTTAQSNYPARVRASGAAYAPISAFNGRDKVLIWTWKGVDLTTATWRGQIRSRPDAGGAALATWDFATIPPELLAGDTIVTGILTTAAIAALPAAAEPGTASLFYADFTIEPAGGIEETFQAGEFYRTGSITI